MVLVMFAGCSDSESTENASDNNNDSQVSDTDNSSEKVAETEKELTKLKIAYMPNYPSMWSVCTAVNKGYFAEQGLEVELVEFADGPTEIAAMESGSISLAYIGQGAHKLCLQEVVSIFCFSQLSNSDAVIGAPGIETVADLRGKKIAYASGTSSESILINTLALEGMTLDDIEAYDMDASAVVTAMLSGGVDACSTWAPNTLQVLSELEGSKTIADNLTFKDTALSVSSWVALPEYLEENRDIVLSFTKAIYKAMDYASQSENYEEAAGYVAKQTAQDVQTVIEQLGTADWPTGEEVAKMAEDGTLQGYYLVQQKNFIDSGAFTEDQVPELNAYIDFDIMIEAGK
jgi:NitT/TauT family transport system substrate-binding protein